MDMRFPLFACSDGGGWMWLAGASEAYTGSGLPGPTRVGFGPRGLGIRAAVV